MKMTGRQAIEAQRALQMVGRKPVKIAGAVRIAKAIQELNTVSSVIEKRRKALLDEHAVKDPNGKLVVDGSGNATFADDARREAFGVAYNALMDEPLEIEVQPLDVVALGDVEIEPTMVAPLVAAGLIE